MMLLTGICISPLISFDDLPVPFEVQLSPIPSQSHGQIFRHQSHTVPSGTDGILQVATLDFHTAHESYKHLTECTGSSVDSIQ